MKIMIYQSVIIKSKKEVRELINMLEKLEKII